MIKRRTMTTTKKKKKRNMTMDLLHTRGYIYICCIIFQIVAGRQAREGEGGGGGGGHAKSPPDRVVHVLIADVIAGLTQFHT